MPLGAKTRMGYKKLVWGKFLNFDCGITQVYIFVK